jgi:hypothetical protein
LRYPTIYIYCSAAAASQAWLDKQAAAGPPKKKQAIGTPGEKGESRQYPGGGGYTDTTIIVTITASTTVPHDMSYHYDIITQSIS